MSTMISEKQELKIVVLDDDPTGIQTVHDNLLLTCWDTSTLQAAFEDSMNFFYILTNTRAKTQNDAAQTVSDAVEQVLTVNREYDKKLIFISRSDSTLRSHFPLEINSIISRLHTLYGEEVDAVFLVPAFFETGRLTKNDTHFIEEDGTLVPTDQTEFARDSVFGYSSSHLPTYIEEKTTTSAGSRSRHAGQAHTGEDRTGRGRIGQDQAGLDRDEDIPVTADDVLSLPLEYLREREGSSLSQFLAGLHDRQYVVVNCENYQDLDRFAEAIRTHVHNGKNFVFQSSSSFPRALSGIGEKGYLDNDIIENQSPGIAIVGSHVKKTTEQLEALLKEDHTSAVEADVRAVLDNPEREKKRILASLQVARSDGMMPVVYTSREELRFDSQEERLHAGQLISDFLSDLVVSLPFTPSFIISKGGITSHDILVKGLQVKRARVLGQVLPGVPVIRVPEGNSFAGTIYIIFPGNVGDTRSLATVYRTLR
jgi:uncharacterized protein YgbK (DUF1537 family)